jgi:hypothetical protein
VQVNPPTVGVDQEQLGRPAGHGSQIRLEPHAGQRCFGCRAVVTGDDQVQVLVGPAVVAEQRVNTPAAIQPDHQPGLIELVENHEHVAGVQHRRSQPPPERDDNRLCPRLAANSQPPEKAGDDHRGPVSATLLFK